MNKVPRRLYSTAEISKYFSLNGQSIRNIWNTNYGMREVVADNGKKYLALYITKETKAGLNSFVQLKLVK